MSSSSLLSTYTSELLITEGPGLGKMKNFKGSI